MEFSFWYLHDLYDLNFWQNNFDNVDKIVNVSQPYPIWSNAAVNTMTTVSTVSMSSSPTLFPTSRLSTRLVRLMAVLLSTLVSTDGRCPRKTWETIIILDHIFNVKGNGSKYKKTFRCVTMLQLCNGHRNSSILLKEARQKRNFWKKDQKDLYKWTMWTMGRGEKVREEVGYSDDPASLFEGGIN